MSVLGTIASAAGGGFIALIHILFTINTNNITTTNIFIHYTYVLLFGCICGIVGSLFDSILGATLQATYYDIDKKLIINTNNIDVIKKNNNILHICGMNILSNEFYCKTEKGERRVFYMKPKSPFLQEPRVQN